MEYLLTNFIRDAEKNSNLIDEKALYIQGTKDQENKNDYVL